MPIDISNLNRTKEIMISFVRARGPSLPIHIAQHAKVSPLFASAFLSEIYNEGKIKMSHMKIGSSSLYYLPEQENQLENFSQHLNSREKEAFELLKREKIAEDSKLTPVLRVAIRAIKDFANPLKINENNESKLFWKYFTIPEQEALQIISKNYPKQKEEKILPTKEEIGVKTELPPIKEEKKKKLRKEKPQDYDFSNLIKSYMNQKNMELISIFLDKKKEFSAIIRLETNIGKHEYYLIAKDKKKISETDIDEAYEKSKSEKIPIILLAPAELDKKASAKIVSLRNIIKFIRLPYEPQ